jgi:beta-lactamase class A
VDPIASGRFGVHGQVTTRQVTTRRVVVGAALGAAVAAALTGCGSAAPGPPVAPASSPPDLAGANRALAALEAGFGGRVGVAALDTGTGASIGHRADERFPLCSTHKVLAASAILRLRTSQPGLLDRLVRYDHTVLVPYSPVTGQHLATGMTVSALCAAAITYSDNTAANLLVDLLGGPPAVTAFARSLGDPVTRLDRTEPTLNDVPPGDQRDTTSPARMAADLRALTLGDALDPAGRDMLTGWLLANTTGGKQIRAGLPASWRVGDKTGSGTRGEDNDVAVAWPPGRAPLLIAVYTVPANPAATFGAATVAEAARTTARALAP